MAFKRSAVRSRLAPLIIDFSSSLQEALRLICNTPGYAQAGGDLARLAEKNCIRVNLALKDRAHAGLLGTITLGPETIEASALSLAQTLVHEHFHLRRQNPFLKTVSFWSGVLTRSPAMKRYEQPAYQAAHDFLEAAKKAHPQLAREAEREQAEIRQVFAVGFGGTLNLFSEPGA